MDFKRMISQLIYAEGLTPDEIYDSLTPPKDSKLGDLCFPCFKLSRAMRMSPVAIAEKLAADIVRPDYLESIEAVQGYLNFKLSRAFFAKTTIEKVLNAGDAYGSSAEGAGKTVCIDYSSINIAKPFHIGHLSTTVIGAALYRIYNFLGYRAVGINHLGDWGTQFGKLIVALKRWGNREELEREGVRGMLKIYVRFHSEAELDDSLNEEARQWFLKIEENDSEAVEIFHWFKDLTLREVQLVYDRLDIHFDSFAGESFYNDKMQAVLDELEDKGLLVESQGASVVELPDMPPCLLRKKDGATLYATRDLAAAFYRKKTYDFEKCLYVVAYQQNLHFKQWFKVIELMGYPWYTQLEHVAFGMVSLEGNALSTRHGNVVFLEEVLDKAVEKASEIITSKGNFSGNTADIAEQIGVGAVVFSALYNSRIKDISFSYDKVLNFEGETGPYVQYTHARACSLLKKAQMGTEIDYSGVTNDEAMELVRALDRFPDIVRESAKRNEPSMVTRAVMDIAQCYNKFYLEHRIIGEAEGIKNARLSLTAAARNTIATGLRLVGIKAPESM